MTEHTIIKGSIWGFDSDGERWGIALKFTTVDTSRDAVRWIAVGIASVEAPHVAWVRAMPEGLGYAYVADDELIPWGKVSEPMKATAELFESPIEPHRTEPGHPDYISL